MLVQFFSRLESKEPKTNATRKELPTANNKANLLLLKFAFQVHNNKTKGRFQKLVKRSFYSAGRL